MKSRRFRLLQLTPLLLCALPPDAIHAKSASGGGVGSGEGDEDGTKDKDPDEVAILCKSSGKGRMKVPCDLFQEHDESLSPKYSPSRTPKDSAPMPSPDSSASAAKSPDAASFGPVPSPGAGKAATVNPSAVLVASLTEPPGAPMGPNAPTASSSPKTQPPAPISPLDTPRPTTSSVLNPNTQPSIPSSPNDTKNPSTRPVSSPNSPSPTPSTNVAPVTSPSSQPSTSTSDAPVPSQSRQPSSSNTTTMTPTSAPVVNPVGQAETLLPSRMVEIASPSASPTTSRPTENEKSTACTTSDGVYGTLGGEQRLIVPFLYSVELGPQVSEMDYLLDIVPGLEVRMNDFLVPFLFDVPCNSTDVRSRQRRATKVRRRLATVVGMSARPMDSVDDTVDCGAGFCYGMVGQITLFLDNQDSRRQLQSGSEGDHLREALQWGMESGEFDSDPPIVKVTYIQEGGDRSVTSSTTLSESDNGGLGAGWLAASVLTGLAAVVCCAVFVYLLQRNRRSDNDQDDYSQLSSSPSTDVLRNETSETLDDQNVAMTLQGFGMGDDADELETWLVANRSTLKPIAESSIADHESLPSAVSTEEDGSVLTTDSQVQPGTPTPSAESSIADDESGGVPVAKTPGEDEPLLEAERRDKEAHQDKNDAAAIEQGQAVTSASTSNLDDEHRNALAETERREEEANRGKNDVAASEQGQAVTSASTSNLDDEHGNAAAEAERKEEEAKQVNNDAVDSEQLQAVTSEGTSSLDDEHGNTMADDVETADTRRQSGKFLRNLKAYWEKRGNGE